MQGQVLEPRLSVWSPFWTGPGLIEAVVAHLYGVSPTDLHSTARGGARTAFARHLAMYLTRVVYGMTMTEVAIQFGRDRTTVSHACQRVEDMRDDPALDRLLWRLERMLRDAIDIEFMS
jgi:chromosomal replication initiation ATPase DnaA